MNTGDESGFLLIKAFEKTAQKLGKKLGQRDQCVIQLRGPLLIKDAEIGFEHYCPDGALYLSENTKVKVVNTPVKCPDPQSIELSDMEKLPAYRSHVSVKKALVAKMKVRQNFQGHKMVEMALYDAPEHRCVNLRVRVADNSTLPDRIHSVPFCVSIVEASIELYGDRKQLRAKAAHISEVEGHSLQQLWQKENIDPEKVFSIPYHIKRNMQEIRESCSKLLEGEVRYFKCNAVIKTILRNKETELDKQNMMYLGCPDDTCRKTVQKNGGYIYCPKCKKPIPIPRWRYCLNLQLGDCHEAVQIEEELVQKLNDIDLEYYQKDDYQLSQPVDSDDAGSDDDDDDYDDEDEDEEIRVVAYDGPGNDLMDMKSTDLAQHWDEKRKDMNDRFAFLLDSQWHFGIKVEKNTRSEYGPIIMTIIEVFNFLGKE